MVLVVAFPSSRRSNRGRTREGIGIPPPIPRRLADPVQQTAREGKLPQFEELCEPAAGDPPVVDVREGNLPQFDELLNPFVGSG